MLDNAYIMNLLESEDVQIGTCYEYSSEGELMAIAHNWTAYNEIEKYIDQAVDLEISPHISTKQLISAAYHNLLLYIDLEDIERITVQLITIEQIESGQLSFNSLPPIIPTEIKLSGGNLTIKQAQELVDQVDLDDSDSTLYDLNYDLLDNIPELELGFSDQYDFCIGCYHIIRTSADSYSWTPNYVLVDCEGYFCAECIDQDIIDYVIDDIQDKIDQDMQPRSLPRCVELDDSWVNIPHPSNYGNWVSGLHGGQLDDPLKQGKYIRETFLDSGNEPLFQVAYNVYPSQFDCSWQILIRVNPLSDDIDLYDTDIMESIAESIGYTLDNKENKLPHDPAQLMQQALKQIKLPYASIKTDPNTGEIVIDETSDLEEYLSR